MVVIGGIMAMAMERPGQIVQQSVRMPVIFDHFQMLFEYVEKLGRMVDRRHQRPKRERQTQKRRKSGSSSS